MKIDFTYPDLPHPNSDLTILELANILEAKYQVCETFSKSIMSKFEKEVQKEYKRKGYIHKQRMLEWLKMQWREYIISGKAGFTIASQKRGDPAFVQTSAYYLSLQPQVVLDKKEKEFFK